MEELIQDIHKCRFISNEKHVKLLQDIVDEIVGLGLMQDDIVSLLSNVDAEIVDDIIKMLEDNNYISKEEGIAIDSKLVKIYDEEFVRDMKSGVLKSRLALKTDKNIRPINRFEILGIFFSRTLNDKLLWGREETNDEILKALVQTHQELCVVRKSNAIYDKQQKNMEGVLTEILDDLNSRKIQTI